MAKYVSQKGMARAVGNIRQLIDAGMADGSVTTAKLADKAVTMEKLSDALVQRAILSDTVEFTKDSSDGITIPLAAGYGANPTLTYTLTLEARVVSGSGVQLGPMYDGTYHWDTGSYLDLGTQWAAAKKTGVPGSLSALALFVYTSHPAAIQIRNLRLTDSTGRNVVDLPAWQASGAYRPEYDTGADNQVIPTLSYVKQLIAANASGGGLTRASLTVTSTHNLTSTNCLYAVTPDGGSRQIMSAGTYEIAAPSLISGWDANSYYNSVSGDVQYLQNGDHPIYFATGDCHIHMGGIKEK